MKLEEQVVSLGLAKRLKELGVQSSIRIGHGSAFYWVLGVDGQYELMFTDGHSSPEDVSAPTAAELGQMLPLEYRTHKVLRDGTLWACADFPNEEFVAKQETEADARAELLIFLIDNGLLSVSGLGA